VFYVLEKLHGKKKKCYKLKVIVWNAIKTNIENLWKLSFRH